MAPVSEIDAVVVLFCRQKDEFVIQTSPVWEQSLKKTLDCAQQEEFWLNVSSTLIYKSVVPCLYMSHSIALCSPEGGKTHFSSLQLWYRVEAAEHLGRWAWLCKYFPSDPSGLQQDRIDPLLTLRSILGLSDCLCLAQADTCSRVPFTCQWSHT